MNLSLKSSTFGLFDLAVESGQCFFFFFEIWDYHQIISQVRIRVSNLNEKDFPCKRALDVWEMEKIKNEMKYLHSIGVVSNLNECWSKPRA